MNAKRLLPIVALGCAAVLWLVSIAAGQRESAEQPHMHSALQHLQQAEQELQAAEHDKGGHRQQAIHLISQAQREVQAGIQYDDQHEGREEHGGAHHDPVRITNGPVVETLGDREATIAWSTNVPGSSRVEFGTDPRNLNRAAQAPWGANGDTHRVRMENLNPNTTYFFTVETENALGTGTEVESKYTYSFRTLPPGAQSLHNQPTR